MPDRPLAVGTGGASFIGRHVVDPLVDRGAREPAIENLVGGRAANLRIEMQSREGR